MEDAIKSGKEIIDQFFSDIDKIEGVDKDTVLLFSNLYQENKFTESNIKNALQLVRDKKYATENKKS